MPVASPLFAAVLARHVDVVAVELQKLSKPDQCWKYEEKPGQIFRLVSHERGTTVTVGYSWHVPRLFLWERGAFHRLLCGDAEVVELGTAKCSLYSGDFASTKIQNLLIQLGCSLNRGQIQRTSHGGDPAYHAAGVETVWLGWLSSNALRFDNESLYLDLPSRTSKRCCQSYLTCRASRRGGLWQRRQRC